MGGKKDTIKQDGLLALPVSRLVYQQVDIFARGLIHDNPVMVLSPSETKNRLKKYQDKSVIGIDIGGDKYFEQAYKVNRGLLSVDGEAKKIKSRSGSGYIAALQSAVNQANGGRPIGLSIGVTLDGTKPARSTGRKLPDLRDDLSKDYNNDFSQLLGEHSACINDGPAGLIGSLVHAQEIYGEQIENVIFVINGGGIGAAVLTNNTVFATEAGHVPLAEDLQKYKDERSPKSFGHNAGCIENAAGNKLGIEYFWEQEQGSKLTAIEIEKRYTNSKPGGDFALELYDYSATIVAHLAVGLAQTFDIELASPKTVVVGHGGAFKFPNYTKRIKQIIDKDIKAQAQVCATNDFSDNACAEGAAIAAINLA